MSNTQSFADLNFDRLWTANAERDKTTSINIGVYRGNAAIAVFSGQSGGGPKIRIPLPRQFNVLFRAIFTAVRKTGPDTKITVPIQKWDPENKKMQNIASVTFGIDASNIPYIGVVATGQPGFKFPIRPDLKWDISTVAELNANHIALDTFLAAMDNCTQAINLTSFKLDTNNAPRQGGARPSYNSRPAATDIDDEIPF